jgi:hypothetical protein
LHLTAEVSTHREPLDVPRAEKLYQQAMEQAGRLGARPLMARCHLGLGRLYRRAGSEHDARVHHGAAAALFREMRMPLWSDRADAELRLMRAR